MQYKRTTMNKINNYKIKYNYMSLYKQCETKNTEGKRNGPTIVQDCDSKGLQQGKVNTTEKQRLSKQQFESEFSAAVQ